MTRTPRILLIDDEVSLQPSVMPLLRSRGYQVDVVEMGKAALARVAEHQPDVVLLDLGESAAEGPEVCRQLRSVSPAPILVVSARTSESDKVSALDLGADDYITKPFGTEELLARVRAALRRAFPADGVASGQLRLANLVIDYDRRRVIRGNQEIRLTPKEFDLFTLLVQNPDRIITHRAILKAIWGPDAVDQPEHLWVLMSQLRKKIETDPAQPRILLSEPWVGYRLCTQPETATGSAPESLTFQR